MTRLRQVPRSEAEQHPGTKFAYDLVFGPDRDPVDDPGSPDGTPGDWWTTFAAVPDIMDHCLAGFAVYRNPQRKLPPRLRELGQARAGWLRSSAFVFSQHCRALRDAGYSDGHVTAIPSWSVATCFTDEERAVLAYTDGLVGENGRVPDGVFAALQQHLDDEQILELTYITALYEMHAIMSRALRTEMDDVPDPMDLVDGYQPGAGGLKVGR
ncbi:MAG TPA: carboxymuconolactone decarboxylase family protein [Acidimicrobiales bacterium]|nr:carboxymuconolactone decarboxylase family protein [Acidimicrobiales bacterium]